MNKKFKSVILSLVSCCFASLVAWSGFTMSSSSWANAATLDNSYYMMNVGGTAGENVNRAGEVITDKVRSNIDTVGGYGTSERIEGKGLKDGGTLQRKVGDVVDNDRAKFEGAGKEVQGSAKQTAGKVKAATEDTANKVEEAADNAVDAVKDFFKR